MRSKRIDLRVTDAEKVDWEKAAKKLGLDLSGLIRRAVEDLLAKK